MSSILYTLRETSMNQTTVTNRRYQKELGFALLLYMALLVGALLLSADMQAGAPRTAVLPRPLLAVARAVRAQRPRGRAYDRVPGQSETGEEGVVGCCIWYKERGREEIDV